MPVTTDINALSASAASNSPPGSEAPSLSDDYLRQAFAFIAQLRDRAASGVAFTPVGGLSATTVQAALAELDSEKANASAVPDGTYTPTLTNVANASSLSASVCQWLRVGSTVTVSGTLSVSATAAGEITIGISLPAASNFTSAVQCAGTAVRFIGTPGDAAVSAAIRSDATNNRAELRTTSTSATGIVLYFTFTYQVL